MSQEKKRNLITREIILEILGKTEEHLKEGLSITEVLRLFVKYRLQLRVFIFIIWFTNTIHLFEIIIIKLFYCRMKGDHIYTLNHNIDRLTQQFAKHRPDDDDDKDVVAIKPSSN